MLVMLVFVPIRRWFFQSYRLGSLAGHGAPNPSRRRTSHNDNRPRPACLSSSRIRQTRPGAITIDAALIKGDSACEPVPGADPSDVCYRD